MNAFGEPLVEPARLTDSERFEILTRAVARLRADTLDTYTREWLASALERALSGASLDAVLGVAGLQRVAQRTLRDSLRTQLATACGSTTLAAKVLEGVEPCPAAAVDLLDQLQQSAAGKHRTTIWRSVAKVRG